MMIGKMLIGRSGLPNVHFTIHHSPFTQKLRPAFACGFGQRLDAAVIDVRAAVENDFRHAGLGGALGDQLANGSAAATSAPVFSAPLTSFSRVEAAATVWPRASSMTWA
jgi:hypothetical protein